MLKLYITQIKSMYYIIYLFEVISYLLFSIVFYFMWKKTVIQQVDLFGSGVTVLLMLIAGACLLTLSIMWRVVLKNVGRI